LPQQGLLNDHGDPCFEEYSLQTSENFRLETFYYHESQWGLILSEESIDVDENKIFLSFRSLSPLFLSNLSGRKLKDYRSIHFNFAHNSFFELDLPPPTFLFS